jgi:hypothetical protein
LPWQRLLIFDSERERKDMISPRSLNMLIAQIFKTGSCSTHNWSARPLVKDSRESGRDDAEITVMRGRKEMVFARAFNIQNAQN